MEDHWKHILALHYLEPALLEELGTYGIIRELAAGTQVLQPGDYVAGVPIVLEGLLKVERIEENRELLLYYIKPGESCIMSFASATQDAPSEVAAFAEMDSRIILLPREKLMDWRLVYPNLQSYFLALFQTRYQGLIHTIDQLAFQRMDTRIISHLQKKADTLNTKVFLMTHQELADEMGTSREVISRALKKLELDTRVRLGRNKIELV